MLRLQRDRSAVSTVFANALMVAMTVGMAGSLFVMTTSLISPYTPPAVSFLTFQSSGTYGSATPDYCCLNDSYVQVIEVGGNPLPWSSSLQFVIRSLTGEILLRGDLEPTPADPYLGIYHAGPGTPSVPVVGYEDVEPLGWVTPADTVQIYGMSEEYHGATLQVLEAPRILSQLTIE